MPGTPLARSRLKLMLALFCLWQAITDGLAAPGDNIALASNGGTAAMSSLWTPSWPASNCINGVTVSFANSALCHSGRSPSNFEWLDLTLPSAKPIDRIVIHNRRNCCATRVRNMLVMVSNTPFPAATTAAGLAAARTQSVFEFQVNDTGNTITIPVNNQSGRYVRLQKTGTGNVTRHINLLEVQVIEGDSAGQTVSGFVVNDRNVNGTRDTADAGLEGTTVTLHSASDNACFSKRTNGSGYYAFTGVDPGSYTLINSATESIPLPATCPPGITEPVNYLPVTAGSLAITVLDADLDDNNFLLARVPFLGSASETSIRAGGTVTQAMQFTAGADGLVSFTTDDFVPASGNWRVIQYRDTNCNSQIDPADTVLRNPISVSASEIVCLLVKVFAESTLTAGTHLQYNLSYEFSYADPAGIGHALASTAGLINTVRVRESFAGSLTVIKLVRNASAGTAIARNTSARPGELLTYTIEFTNTGTGSLYSVVVKEATPLFSTLASPARCPATLPPRLTGCSVTSPALADNQAGYQGHIEWRFDGELAAGASGAVTLEVMVE